MGPVTVPDGYDTLNNSIVLLGTRLVHFHIIISIDLLRSFIISVIKLMMNFIIRRYYRYTIDYISDVLVWYGLLTFYYSSLIYYLPLTGNFQNSGITAKLSSVDIMMIFDAIYYLYHLH